MSDAAPLVSVIMPLHNSAAFMRVGIASVQAQTLRDWELWLIDDASTDDTLAIARELSASDPRLHVLSLSRNVGAARARNAGIGAARGRYIAFLDSDDEWMPEKLKKQIAFMEEKKAAFSFTRYLRCDAEGRLFPVSVPGRLSYKDLLKQQAIGCLTVLYDTALCGKQTMPPIKRRNDYALWLQITRQGFDAFGLDEPLARYHVRAGSLSSNKALAALYVWRVFRTCEGLGLFRSAYYFLHYAQKTLVRTLREKRAKG